MSQPESIKIDRAKKREPTPNGDFFRVLTPCCWTILTVVTMTKHTDSTLQWLALVASMKNDNHFLKKQTTQKQHKQQHQTTKQPQTTRRIGNRPHETITLHARVLLKCRVLQCFVWCGWPKMYVFAHVNCKFLSRFTTKSVWTGSLKSSSKSDFFAFHCVFSCVGQPRYIN